MSKSAKKKFSHTPEPWIVRHLNNSDTEFFVQGPRLKPEHPYDVEILADDHGNELYPTEVKLADAERIVACVNACKGISNEDLKLGVISREIAK